MGLTCNPCPTIGATAPRSRQREADDEQRELCVTLVPTGYHRRLVRSYVAHWQDPRIAFRVKNEIVTERYHRDETARARACPLRRGVNVNGRPREQHPTLSTNNPSRELTRNREMCGHEADVIVEGGVAAPLVEIGERSLAESRCAASVG
jgi:hypothetical protein